MDAIAKLETIKLRVDERRLKDNELQQKKRIKRKLWQLMIANANPEQAARKVAASAAALAAPTPPPPPLPLPLPAPAEDASVEPQTVEIEDRHDPALNPPQGLSHEGLAYACPARTFTHTGTRTAAEAVET